MAGLDYWIKVLKYHSAALLGLFFHWLRKTVSLLLVRSLDAFDVELFLKFACQLHEDVLDVLSFLGRALHKGELLLVAELVDLVLRDLALIIEI